MSDKALVRVDAAPLVTTKPTSNALTLAQNAGTAAYGPEAGPANPFKSTFLKRKNVPTGHAQEVALSDYTFRAAQQSYSKPARGSQPVVKRQKRGDSSIVDGAGAYRGPWARYEHEALAVQDREVGDGDEDRSLASDEEYVEIYEDEDEDGDGDGPAPVGPMPKASTSYEEDKSMSETTAFHGDSERDYLGRTYMHVDQTLDMDLRREPETIKRYVPKKLIHTWKSHAKAITALEFFPQTGHLLLSSSADSTVKLWDAFHERRLLRTVSGHSKAVTDAKFAPDGLHFLTASFDRQMKLFDTETGLCKGRYSTGKTANVLAFNPSRPHEFLAGMADNKIVQFDTRTAETVQTYDHHLGPVNTLTFYDDDRSFMSTSDDKSLRAWSYNIPVPIKLVSSPEMFSLTNAALHPSGKHAAFQSGDDQILVFSAGDRIKQNRKKGFRGHRSAGYSVGLTFAPDGELLITGDSSGEVVAYDWKRCAVVDRWKASEGPVTRVQWHPQESSKVATAGLDGTIKYWD